MSSTAYLGILVLVLCGSTVVRSRYVDPAISSTPSVVGSTPSIVTSTPSVVDNRNVTEQHEAPPETRDVTFDASTLFDGLELAGFRDSNSLESTTELNERTFDDMLPYFGSVIFRGVVRRALIKPMVRGMKKLVPKSFYNYYNEVLASKRVFQLMSPLSPAISTYAYTKFEQGVFWGIKRGYGYVVDNFIEFEKRKRSTR